MLNTVVKFKVMLAKKPTVCKDCDFCDVENCGSIGWCVLLSRNVENVSKAIDHECPIN